MTNHEAYEVLIYATGCYARARSHGQIADFQACVDEALWVYQQIPLPPKDPEDVKVAGFGREIEQLRKDEGRGTPK